MSQSIFKLQSNDAARFYDFTARLVEEIEADLIGTASYQMNGVQRILYVFERGYLRTESVASLTVLFTCDGHQVFADVIASGAGAVFFNISWGANADFAKQATTILEKLGFVVVNDRTEP